MSNEDKRYEAEENCVFMHQFLCSQLSCWHKKDTGFHTNTNSTFPEVCDICHHFSGLSILVVNSAIGHTHTVTHMYAPALKGNPRPLNWHLSVRPASCTDRNITSDGERRSVSNGKTEEAAWKTKKKGGRGERWRGEGKQVEVRLLKLVRYAARWERCSVLFGVLARHCLFDLLACVYDVVSLSASVNLYY